MVTVNAAGIATDFKVLPFAHTLVIVVAYLKGKKKQDIMARETLMCALLTRPVECTVLIGVQSNHLAYGPHVVPQHDALSLHHEEVCVG